MRFPFAALLAITLAACSATPKLSVPEDFPQLTLKADEENTLSFADPKARFEQYNKLYIAPVKVEHGNGTTMQEVDVAEAKVIAVYMQNALKNTLSKEFEMVEQPGKDVLSIKFRIIDLQPTSAAQIAMMVPPFALINLVSTNGAFLGSMTFAGEFLEGMNSGPSAAFVAFRSRPGADATVAFGRWTAVESVIDKAAERLAQDLKANREGKLGKR